MDNINLYCDESNHLIHNTNNFMTLGFISCPSDKSKATNEYIRSLKEKHGMNRQCEIKWTKVSSSKIDFYKGLIEYFFNNDYLQFRCVIADKTRLDYERFGINHDSWYYRMYYLLLGKSLNESNAYSIYLDIKDTCSSEKVQKLKTVLNNSYYDFSSSMIKKVQHVHSHEVEILQLNDLFIGAIGYANKGTHSSDAKIAVIELLKQYSHSTLVSSTSLNDKKFNIFVWEAR